VKGKVPYLFIPGLAVIFLDQVSKGLVLQKLSVHARIPLVEGLFNLVHVRNRGMAFGLMNRAESGWMFYALVAATIAAIALLFFWFTRLEQNNKRITTGFSLIIGGAIGNLIDRVRLGEVIDFLDFHIHRYHWPAFNIADAAITVGTFWVALHLLFQRAPARKTE
jgi:signal peptidase II